MTKFGQQRELSIRDVEQEGVSPLLSKKIKEDMESSNHRPPPPQYWSYKAGLLRWLRKVANKKSSKTHLSSTTQGKRAPTEP